MPQDNPLVIVKGAGDLASGIAYRLFRCGLRVILTELSQPLVVRRAVAFAEAVYEKTTNVEGVTAALAKTRVQAMDFLDNGIIPVVIDPDGDLIKVLRPQIVVDARIAKRNMGTTITEAPLVIGIGPGFTAGRDVHAVIESCRGHNLGRVIYDGGATPNTGTPGAIDGHTWSRLLRAPVDGCVTESCSIGDVVEQGEVVAVLADTPVRAEIAGVVRGMIRKAVWVPKGTKIGDIDPRKDTQWNTISDKSLAVGGGVLEAVFHFLSC